MATPRERLLELLREEGELTARLEYLALEAQGMLETLVRLLPLAVKSREAWERWLDTFKSAVRLVGFDPAPGVGGEENLRDLMGKLHWTQRDIEYLREVMAGEKVEER